MRRLDWLGLLLAVPAIYLAMAGVGFALESIVSVGVVHFEVWHPLLAAFVGCGSGAVVAFAHPSKEECRDCRRLERRLERTRRELAETRQALLVLELPPPDDAPKAGV